MVEFRKPHSTNTLLLKIRDNILRAMSKGELNFSVYSDYSKAFDIVQHHTIIQMLHKIGFAIAALKWFISYFGNRSQYVQVDDSKSATKPCHFGLLQGSVLDPLLFNLYVNDLQDIDPADFVNTCQYAENTTQYEHFKISQLQQTIQNTQKRLNNLSVWLRNNNLLLNGAKTKYIIFSSTKIKQNFLQNFEYSFDLNNDKVQKVDKWKVLGMFLQENLSWEKHIDQLICTCYKKLFVLKKINRFAPQKTKKHLAEALIISKIDYGNIIYSNVSQNSLMRLQKLLKATFSFVNGRYSNSVDVILLGWLPINERIDFCLIKLAHKALYVTSFPPYLELSFEKLSRNLRNKDEFLINNCDKNSNTFIGKARILFNNLPYQIQRTSNFISFSGEVKKHLLDQDQAKHFQRH